MSKGFVYLSVTIFSLIGSYIPAIWHAGFLSLASILGGFIGAFFGVWVAAKLGDYIG
jgi:hypothetical protein